MLQSVSSLAQTLSPSLYLTLLPFLHFLSTLCFILFTFILAPPDLNIFEIKTSPASHFKHQLLLIRISECQAQIFQNKIRNVSA